jgi:serine/threonine protein kinase/regulation of enolase protein 1 (concanavalin A-like superfamily)
MLFLTPTTLINNRYRIVRSIGHGGMGAVYEAIDERLNTTVALKQTMVSGEHFNKAFEREAKLLAMLHHRALPTVSDYFVDSNGQFLVMRFIPGTDLGALLTQRGNLFPVDTVLDWAQQLLNVLECLHTRQPPILHRDIKPQNIKLTEDGELVLLDFGLAKGAISAQSAVRSLSSLYGYTPQYASLEQIKGTGTDPRSDLYSVGATLHHLLTNVVPVDALDRVSAIIAGQPDPLRPVRELNPQMPAAIEAVVMGALSLDPNKRPVSASAMWAALAAARAQSISGAILPDSTMPRNVRALPTSGSRTVMDTTVPVGPPHISGPKTTGGEPLLAGHVTSKRRPSSWIVGLIALGLLAAVGGVGILAFQPRSTPTPELQSLAEVATEAPTSAPTTLPPTAVPPSPQPPPTALPPTTVPPSPQPPPPTLPPTALPPTALPPSPTPLSGDILFGLPDSPSTLNSIFEWRQGSSPNSSYDLDGGPNKVQLHTGPNTDQWESVDTAPLLVFPIEGDFIAQVKVLIDPQVSYQRAGLGIRSAQDHSTWINISRQYSSGDVVQGYARQQRVSSGLQFTGYPNDTIYLRTERSGDSFTLSYSEDGSNWTNLETGYVVAMPQGVQVYLFVLSTIEEEITAEFSDLKIILK